MIDWVTVSAQVINFLVLVYLLKRFLYAPVMTAMNRREQRIAERLTSAGQREQDAEDEARHYKGKSEDLDHRRNEIMAQAEQEATAMRKQMEDEARAEIEQKRNKWQADIEREREEFLKALRKQAAESVINVTRKVLHDLADTQLESQLIRTFLHRFDNISEEERRTFRSLRAPAQVTTSFQLNEEQRAHISKTISKEFGRKIEIEFRRSPELICGIDLRVESHKLGWNTAGYLDELERRITEKLGAADEP